MLFSPTATGRTKGGGIGPVLTPGITRGNFEISYYQFKLFVNFSEIEKNSSIVTEYIFVSFQSLHLDCIIFFTTILFVVHNYLLSNKKNKDDILR